MDAHTHIGQRATPHKAYAVCTRADGGARVCEAPLRRRPTLRRCTVRLQRGTGQSLLGAFVGIARDLGRLPTLGRPRTVGRPKCSKIS